MTLFHANSARVCLSRPSAIASTTEPEKLHPSKKLCSQTHLQSVQKSRPGEVGVSARLRSSTHSRVDVTLHNENPGAASGQNTKCYGLGDR
jgi:hypothetical protein